jgi:AcrR family transcriptional regulator
MDPDRRTQILREALLLFAEHGVEGASLRELARRVGISQPSLYHYFASKEALVEAIFSWQTAEVNKRREAALADARLKTPQRFLLWLGNEIVSRFTEPEALALQKLIHGEAIRGGETARTFARLHIAPMVAGTAAVFSRFMSEGKIRAVDPDHAARAFVTPIIMLVMHQKMMGAAAFDPVDMRAFVDSHVDMFLHGIAR